MRMTRRRFLGASAMAAAATGLAPRAMGETPPVAPSERVTLGVIGTGGKGTQGMGVFLRETHAQVVAVCDVERGARDQAKALVDDFYGNADCATYRDFRELLARSDIDAVLIATPDHWHVPASIYALDVGKDVYCEKPLSNTVREGRALVEAVRRNNAIFQHGTQLRSIRNVRFACELVRNGRLGELKRIVIGSPPGLTCEDPEPPMPIPEGFDYDLWLGPAPFKAYTPRRVKVPNELPCWYFVSDYSKSGWVAGYGVHDVDIAHWGMGVEHSGPVSVEGEGVFPEKGLYDTVTTYRLEFAYPNGVTLEMTSTDQNPHGVRFEGTEGWVFTRGQIEAEPASLLDVEFGHDDVRLYESEIHERNFIECVRSRQETLTPAETAHRSTTVGLIGGIALQLGRKLHWNPETEQFVDDPEANALLSCPMRTPWNVA